MIGQFLLFVVCAFISLCVMSMNWYIFIVVFILKKKASSWVPLLGGVMGVFALLLYSPLSQTLRWIWVPLFLDWGSIPGIGHAIYHYYHVRKPPAQ